MCRSWALNAFPPERPSPLHITAAAVAQLHRALARGTLTKSSPCPGQNQSLSPHGLWGHWQALEGLCGVLVWGRGWEEGWGWGWEEQWEWGWGRLSPRAAVLRVTLLSPPRSGEGRAAAAGTCHSAAPQSAPCSTRLAALIPLIPKNNNGSQQQSRPQEPAVPERAATERKKPAPSWGGGTGEDRGCPPRIGTLRGSSLGGEGCAGGRAAISGAAASAAPGRSPLAPGHLPGSPPAAAQMSGTGDGRSCQRSRPGWHRAAGTCWQRAKRNHFCSPGSWERGGGSAS